MGVPADQQILYLTLSPDDFSEPFQQELARRLVASGKPGIATEFVVARDDPSQRVIDALGAEVVYPQGAAPPPASPA